MRCLERVVITLELCYLPFFWYYPVLDRRERMYIERRAIWLVFQHALAEINKEFLKALQTPSLLSVSTKPVCALGPFLSSSGIPESFSAVVRLSELSEAIAVGNK